MEQICLEELLSFSLQQLRQSSSNGVCYNLVDMDLNGGLGDVVPGQKNIPLFQTRSEKLEVVPTNDAMGYWLITHDNPGNSFFAFKITDAGIDANPVVSTIGGNHGNGSGHLKINRQQATFLIIQ